VNDFGVGLASMMTEFSLAARHRLEVSAASLLESGLILTHTLMVSLPLEVSNEETASWSGEGNSGTNQSTIININIILCS